MYDTEEDRRRSKVFLWESGLPRRTRLNGLRLAEVAIEHAPEDAASARGRFGADDKNAVRPLANGQSQVAVLNHHLAILGGLVCGLVGDCDGAAPHTLVDGGRHQWNGRWS